MPAREAPLSALQVVMKKNKRWQVRKTATKVLGALAGYLEDPTPIMAALLETTLIFVSSLPHSNTQVARAIKVVHKV